MQIVERVGELRKGRLGWNQVGLVPTMGFLHDGHLSLIQAARAADETVIMSLFVNPSQFGPSEDFASYPRDPKRDLELAEKAGVDVVFAPSIDEVYPSGFDTWVEVSGPSRRWEGERRPGHFRGVATVVHKLFQMVQPTRAYFGEKDYQQLVVVKKMVADLNLPVEIIACPTVRQPSGLALSSRNAYLSAEDRQRAALLFRALTRAQRLASQGVGVVSELCAAMEQMLAKEPAIELDYLAIVDCTTLEPIESFSKEARVLAAIYIDKVRLIDNVQLRLGAATSR
jgi:pantoate--beta-alanine ligase